MDRRTKIIATVGPASESPATLKAMINAGMDVARLGLAHEPLDSALVRYHNIRSIAADFEHPIGILVDLPGPKVRLGALPDEGLALAENEEIRLEPGNEPSSAEVLTVSYDRLLGDLMAGDALTFGDGAVVARVVDQLNGGLLARVIHGGMLRGRPGVHIPSERLRVSTPTPEDLRLLDAFIEAGVDMAALSFVRSAHDVRRIGTEPHPRGPLVVAKIETRSAVDNLDAIIEASGAIMVARGDLGAECAIEELPHLQKRIIQRCIALGRPAITATQMLESMVAAPVPTRAEASDVANAVFDGSSALMLSGETAIGDDPINAVATMARIAERADQEFDYDGWAGHLAAMNLFSASEDDAVTNAMTMAAWRAAAETDASAIICISQSGFTVRSIARLRPEARILGFTDDARTYQQLSLSWGSAPFLVEEFASLEELRSHAIGIAKDRGQVRVGDLVAVISGSREDRSRAADTLRLVRVA